PIITIYVGNTYNSIISRTKYLYITNITTKLNVIKQATPNLNFNKRPFSRLSLTRHRIRNILNSTTDNGYNKVFIIVASFP
ncbi:MAG: hypothetical protein K6C11_00560, partial [Bacilli bacterium]|nr:hypothetical protein [Bacilli bacterium]